jgi:hypothetical protein
VAKPVQDSLLREIDEDLRRERYALLWSRYGWVIITLLVALVLGVAGYEGWRAYQQRVQIQSGERFAAAMTLAGVDPATAAGAFRELAEDAPRGYEILARLREAALHLEQNDHAAAAAVYETLAGRTGDPLYSDLAVILRVMADMQMAVTPANAAELAERLAPLTAPDRPWRYSAQEMSAHLALRSGETEKARELLTGLSVDAQAPDGIRARAEGMLAEIGRG